MSGQNHNRNPAPLWDTTAEARPAQAPDAAAAKLETPGVEAPGAEAAGTEPFTPEFLVGADEGPGAILMAERRAQSLSLGDIARQLKLSVRQVEALERDDYDAFAGMVFVRGFVRNYAKLLQLDPEPLLALTRAPAPAAQTPLAPVAQGREAVAARLTLPGRGWVLAALVLLVLVIAAMFESHRGQAPGPATALPPAPLAGSPQLAESPPAGTTAPGPVGKAAPVPVGKAAPVGVGKAAPGPGGTTAPGSVGTTAPGSVGTTAPESLGTTVSAPETALPPAQAQAPGAPAPAAPSTLATPSAPAAAAAEEQLKLVFEGTAWVEIKDGSGSVIFSQLNDPGAQRTVRGRPPLSLVIGNAHAVRLSFRDRPVDLGPHTRVDVARLVLE